MKQPNDIGSSDAAVSETDTNGIDTDRLRMIVESAHLNFLIGAGTSSPFFAPLGNIEDALTEVADVEVPEENKALIRASIQAYFFEKVVLPNLKIVERDKSAEGVLHSYASFLRTLNRILLLRRSTLLSKQVNIFTTNIDMLFETSMEEIGIDFADGFSGKIRPKFDLGEFGTLRYRTSIRYEHRFEIPVFNLVKIHGSAAWLQCQQDNQKADIYFDHALSLVNEVGEYLQAFSPYRLPVCECSQPGEEGVTILPISDLVRKADEKLRTLEAKEKRKLFQAVDTFATCYERLGIVNPDKRKFATTVLNETYYELIRRFANELEKENSVLFVHGFSFRDEHLRDLVLRAARTNPTLQVIVFCYSRSALSLYRQLIPEAEVKNRNIDFVIPPKPNKGENERMISLNVLDSDYFGSIIRDKIPVPVERISFNICEPKVEVSND